MRPYGRRVVIHLASLLLVGWAAPVLGQGPTLDATYQRAHLSTPDWGDLGGASVDVTFPRAALGLDLGLGYDQLSDRRPDRAQSCGLDFCRPGPFRHTVHLNLVRAALGRTVLLRPGVEMALSGSVTFVLQDRSLVHRDTGEKYNDLLTDLGVGAVATVRLSPLLFGLRPLVRGGYHRIFESACAADATCHRSRNLMAVGVGLSWSP